METLPVSSYAAITNTVQLWPEPTAPRVAIQSISTNAAPIYPHGGSQLADMEVFTGNGTNTVTIEAFNLPLNARVTLRATPFSGAHTEYPCAPRSGDSGDIAHSFWQAIVPTPPGAVSFQVRATTQ